MQQRTHSSRSGSTLVEVAVVALILSVALGSIGMFHGSGSRVIAAQAGLVQAQARAHEALERAQRELDGASIAHLVPDPTGPLGSSEISFQKPLGVDAGGAIDWSPLTRLALELEPGESANGLDDDGDGLVDENRLTLTYSVGAPEELSVVLAHDLPALLPGESPNGADDNGDGVVDERGFCVRRVGNLLGLALAVQAHGADGSWTTWTERTSLRLRN